MRWIRWQAGWTPQRASWARRAPALGSVLVALIALGSCQNGGAAPEEVTISRDAFIAVYVDLRNVGLRAPNQLLSDEERDRILVDNGVSQEDLFKFTEVHGRDVVFMRDVWNEIEERLGELRVQPDSGADRSS